MKQVIVFFDLETGGLQARPSIMSRAQWDALEKYGRGPRPVFDVDVMSYGEQHRSGSVKWRYTPGAPIIQIAAIAVDAATLDPIEEFEVKLFFREELATPEALELNSYIPATWTDEAETYPCGLEKFCGFLGRHKTVEMISKAGNPYRVAQLAGHNAASFDLEFVLRSCEDPRWQRYALPGDAPRTELVKSIFFPGSFSVLDTLSLARWWNRSLPTDGCDKGRPDNLKLGTLAERLRIELDAHDALDDVRATVAVAKHLLEAIG